MRRKQVLNLDDVTLDKKVKIQGTQFDRKRKLKDKDWKKVSRMIKKGFNLTQIAEVFNVDPRTIRYGLDEDFRRKTISFMSGKHTGVDVCTFENRVDYKRTLIQKRKIKASSIL